MLGTVWPNWPYLALFNRVCQNCTHCGTIGTILFFFLPLFSSYLITFRNLKISLIILLYIPVSSFFTYLMISLYIMEEKERRGKRESKRLWERVWNEERGRKKVRDNLYSFFCFFILLYFSFKYNCSFFGYFPRSDTSDILRNTIALFIIDTLRSCMRFDP